MKVFKHIPCSCSYTVVCIDDRFSKPIVVFRGKNVAYGFIKAILKEYEYRKKVMKKQFNKNLIMSKEEEEVFHSSNACWICKKLIDKDDVTGKFRGPANWNCTINLQLTRNVPVIIHNLRGYDKYKYNVKIDVIQNGLEKYMTFFKQKPILY